MMQIEQDIQVIFLKKKIEDYNVIIDWKFFLVNLLKKYKNIKKNIRKDATGQESDYTAGYRCLVRCTCKHTKVTCEYVDVSVDDLKELKLYTEVTELYLRENYLNKISSEVLKNLSHLKTLEILNNNLEYIPTNTFQDFNNLEKLILNKNKIRTLSKDMFTD